MSETLIAATSEFSALFPAGAALERVATGFVWAEGGVWVPGANELRFSDTVSYTHLTLPTTPYV